jgi:hypothetical protein
MGYVPGIWQGMTKSAASAETAPTSGASTTIAPDHGHDDASPSHDAPDATRAAPPKVTLWDVVKLLGVFVGIVIAAPFLAFEDAPMGLLIIAFGLWEAWRLSRGVPRAISGPFRVDGATTSTSAR